MQSLTNAYKNIKIIKRIPSEFTLFIQQRSAYENSCSHLLYKMQALTSAYENENVRETCPSYPVSLTQRGCASTYEKRFLIFLKPLTRTP